MHSDERLSFHAHSQTRRATPLGQRSERGFLLDLGSTHENPDAERHDWPGLRTNLFARQALRPNRGQRPLAPFASGRLLSGAREAAIRKVRTLPVRDSWTTTRA